MISPRNPVTSRRGAPAPVAYESLPCGCVAGVYLASISTVELEMVEAKGPNCPVRGHRTGQLVGMGELADSQQN